MLMFTIEFCQPEVIKYQQVCFSKAGQQLDISAIALGKPQVFKEA